MLGYRGKELRLIENGVFEVDFTDGERRRYDMKELIPKYPVVKRLIDEPELFRKGHLSLGGFGVDWNDDIDVDIMTVYECGVAI